MYDIKILLEYLGYLSVFIGSATGLIGAVKTTKDEKGKPNKAGKTVIIVIVISIMVGVATKVGEQIIKNDEKLKKDKADSLSTANMNNLLAGVKQTSVNLKIASENLEKIDNNTTETLVKQKDLFDQQSSNFSTSFKNFDNIQTNLKNSNEQQVNSFNKSFDNFNRLLEQSENLLYPLFPMVVRITLSMPFDDVLLKEYMQRVIKNKEIFINDKNGIYNKRDDILYIFPGSLANFQFNDTSVLPILNGKYFIVFNDSPTSLVPLTATPNEKVDNPITNSKNYDFVIDFKRKNIKLRIYYKFTSRPYRQNFNKLKDLQNKEIEIKGPDPFINSNYKILNIKIYTGTNGYPTFVRLNSNDQIARTKYIHRITLNDMQNNENLND